MVNPIKVLRTSETGPPVPMDVDFKRGVTGEDETRCDADATRKKQIDWYQPRSDRWREELTYFSIDIRITIIDIVTAFPVSI